MAQIDEDEYDEFVKKDEQTLKQRAEAIRANRRNEQVKNNIFVYNYTTILILYYYTYYYLIILFINQSISLNQKQKKTKKNFKNTLTFYCYCAIL